MSCKLAIFDLSGIQKFIFATNEMRDIIGASRIVHDLLFEGIPEVCGVDRNGWRQGTITPPESENCRIVYIGGGNALVLFSSEEDYRYYARLLAQNTFMKSGGAIRLYSACVNLEESQSLNQNQKQLMARLDAQKKSGTSLSALPALPLVAVDNNNYEPLVMVEDGKYATASGYAKRNAGEADKAFETIKPGNLRFRDNFEADRQKDSKNYQAIIHIDGNTMGIKIREFVRNLSGSIWEQLAKMRDLSVCITSLYNNTLKKTLAELYPAESAEGKKVSVRPVVADGDDITVMISSAKSFDFVKIFMTNLEQEKVAAFGADFKPTAAAGVAFVSLKYPFSTAYELADACCKNAKSKTVARCGGAEKFYQNPVSSIDYQICYNNITEDLEEFRSTNYAEGSGITLLRRPYQFNDASEYSYAAFEKECKYWARDSKFARSKLKGLRNSYGVGKAAAEEYFRFLKAHFNSAEELDALDNHLIAPYNAKGEATLFDYLDVMDILWKEEQA